MLNWLAIVVVVSVVAVAVATVVVVVLDVVGKFFGKRLYYVCAKAAGVAKSTKCIFVHF